MMSSQVDGNSSLQHIQITYKEEYKTKRNEMEENKSIDTQYVVCTM